MMVQAGYKNTRGLTLVESLVSLSLVVTMLVGIIGVFLVARISAIHAKHRVVAMNILQEYIENEIASALTSPSSSFGQYTTFVSSDTLPIAKIVDGVTYKISPTPNPPVITADGTASYETVGFVLSWTETGGISCQEKIGVQIADHS